MKAYTKSRVQKLIEKHQRTLTLDDVEKIVELDRIAERIECAVRDIEEQDGFSIDGHFFCGPTFAREQMIRRIVERHKMPTFHFAGVLYALDMDVKHEDLGRTPGKLELIRYMSKLDVSIKKAAKKIDEMFSPDDGDKDGEPIDEWHLCAVLAREIGGSPDEWYDASPKKIRSAIKAIEEKVEAESKALGGRSSGPPKETPKLLAIADFRNKLNELEASWLES